MDILDSSSTTFTISKTEGDSYSKTLVNYKCQEVTNRFELRYRTIEGSGGLVNLYVTSKSEPKVCNPIEIEIKPLSLHHRVRDIVPIKKNDLTITGKFRANQIHDWISHILPDVPPKMTNSDMMELTYQNAYIGTILYCRYRYIYIIIFNIFFFFLYIIEKEKPTFYQIQYLHYQLFEIQSLI